MQTLIHLLQKAPREDRRIMTAMMASSALVLVVSALVQLIYF